MDAPGIVMQALELAERSGFEGSSIPEVGRLLRALAAGRSRLAEAGTGCGVGAAWLVSGMADDASLVTVESDPEQAAAAAELLAGFPNVEVVRGDWRRELPPRAPFDLLFLDGGAWKQRVEDDGPLVLELLAPGGLVVIDDLTPDWSGPDPVRAFWLGRPNVAATEILTTPHTAAILAARLS